MKRSNKVALNNPVFKSKVASQIRRDMVHERMEQDPWYTYNSMRLMQAKLCGRVQEVVFRNVMNRLQSIARSRAAHSL